MLKDNNSIIIVDNKREDLDRIARIFNQHGIGCRTIECDGFELLPTPLTGVKIAFFDINFTDVGDETAILSALRSVLVATISKDNGPFVLVFWTTNTRLVESFKAFVNRDDTYKDLPHPMHISVLDKAQFEAQPEKLYENIDRICSLPLAKCLISFNEELLIASDSCMHNITTLIDVDEPWGEHTKYEKRIKEIFSKISLDTFGNINGRHYPDAAIKESLAPVFLYSLCNNGSTVWKDYLRLDQLSDQEIKGYSIADIAPALNKFYHIDPIVNDPFARGVVRIIDCDDAEFENRIGYTKSEWALERFLQKKKTPANKYAVIAVEYSAACDYANNKNRLHKFMLGMLIKENDYFKYNNHIAENVLNLCFEFEYKGDKCCLIFDLNSSFNEEENEVFTLLGPPMFRLKNEIMNLIVNSHAEHESRIGISRFK